MKKLRNLGVALSIANCTLPRIIIFKSFLIDYAISRESRKYDIHSYKRASTSIFFQMLNNVIRSDYPVSIYTISRKTQSSQSYLTCWHSTIKTHNTFSVMPIFRKWFLRPRCEVSMVTIVCTCVIFTFFPVARTKATTRFLKCHASKSLYTVTHT